MPEPKMSWPSVVANGRPPVLSRRAFLGAAVGTAAVGLLAALGAGDHPIPALPDQSSRWKAAGPVHAFHSVLSQPPNIVLVTIDTLRADQLGSYGHPYMRTPALDAVASAGARFARHLVQEPQTNPSHASLFSGMYPPSNGVRVHGVDTLPTNLETLATVLSSAGYQTAGLFSWVTFRAQYSGLERGFQIYNDLSEVGPPGGGEFDLATRKGHADRTTDAAIAQLELFSASDPFFLWVHYFDPHYPYQPPAGYTNLYDPTYRGSVDGSLQDIDAIQTGDLRLAATDLRRLLSLYQGEISFADTQLGRLFQYLDSQDRADGTILVVTGDHGESMGEHADLNEDGSFFHPHSLYNTEQQVPLLVRYPTRVRPGTVVDAPTQAIDLFPTLLELAGTDVPDQSQGVSLIGLLDASDGGSNRAAFASMPDYTFTSVAAGGWKLIQNNASGLRRLFDIERDAGEQIDQLDAQPDIAGQLTARLHNWMKEVKIA